MSKKAAWAALSFSVLGLVVATLASYTHYQILRDPLYSSFCDVNATVSCTQVLSSRFAVFHGIPVAIFGAMWFAFAALLSVAGLTASAQVRESVPGYLFAGSTLALAVVLYLGYASFVLLKIACPLCLLTYVAVIGLFLVSGAATSFPMMSLPRRASSDLRVLVSSPVAIVLALLLAGASLSAIALFPREGAPASAAAVELDQQARSQVEQFMATEKRVPLVIATQGAKVLIVKFNDYQCPACAASYEMYKPVLAKYQASNPGEVRVVYKDFPLNPGCNETVRQVVHAAACEAAVAVRLAKLKGKGEAMEEWLYTHQEGMTAQSVKQAAREVGQIADFDEKFQSTLESVKGDVALGKQLKIAQTPTFFINGVQFAGAIRPEFFDQAIAYELQHAGGK